MLLRILKSIFLALVGIELLLSVCSTLLWRGFQWDTNSGSIPLESVVKGKNELTIEFQSQPQSQVAISVQTERSAGWVELLSLNFQGKTLGKYTLSFIAR